LRVLDDRLGDQLLPTAAASVHESAVTSKQEWDAWQNGLTIARERQQHSRLVHLSAYPPERVS
jgi:hypothetical protein